jgi:hypothetical protein
MEKNLYLLAAKLFALLLIASPVRATGPIERDSTRFQRAEAGPDALDPAAADSTVLDGDASGRRYVHELEFEAQVAKLSDAYQQLKDLVSQFSGEILNESANNNPEKLSLHLRVSLEQADGFLDALKKLAVQVDKRSTLHREVTLELAELESLHRIKTSYRDDWQTVLAKCKSAGEKREAIQAIQLLSEELAALDGKIDHLNNDLSHTYIKVAFYPPLNGSPVEQQPFGTQLSHSMASGWYNVQGFLIFLAGHWPLCLLAGTALGGGMFLMQRSRKRSEQRVLQSINHLQQFLTLPPK